MYVGAPHSTDRHILCTSGCIDDAHLGASTVHRIPPRVILPWPLSRTARHRPSHPTHNEKPSHTSSINSQPSSHLDPRVADRTPAHLVPARALVVQRGVDDRRIARQHALVPVEVHAEGQPRDLPVLERRGPELGEVGDGGREAGREAAGRHHGHVHLLGRHGCWVLLGGGGGGGGDVPFAIGGMKRRKIQRSIFNHNHTFLQRRVDEVNLKPTEEKFLAPQPPAPLLAAWSHHRGPPSR